MKKNSNIYEGVLAITSEYLGPAAQRFVDRQIENHLEKSPKDIGASDIKKLTQWSCMSMALITDDKNALINYRKNMLALISKKVEHR